MDKPPVSPESQRQLLRWAREVIERAVRSEPDLEIPENELTADLCQPHAAFVTLKKRDELRGCIGKMDFTRPLWENVIGAAVSAALEDSRFMPVEPAELGELHLEISVLEPPVDLPDPAQFDAHRQGIIIEKGWHHALLLPKVAEEYGWGEQKVLETVCLKAGLPAGAWRDRDARLQVFTAFDFAEPVGS